MNAAKDDVTTRFTGLAGLYAGARPDYPAAAIDFILNRCKLGPDSTLVDVGCGTGISSRLFATRGLRVVGIEPNDDMRRQAEVAGFAGAVKPAYRAARAEATGLPAGCADGVLAAQAFHWFDADAALLEFQRILKPQGWVILMWNERDDSDPFSAGYGRILAATPDGPAIQNKRMTAGQALLDHPLYCDGARDVFTHEQQMDEDGLVGRAMSASYAPRLADAVTPFIAALRELFARHQRDGKVALLYETAVYTARAK